MAKKAVLGKTVPDITLSANGDKEISLSDYYGRKLVLYFYPKDNTPGCTRESQEFRDHYTKFKRRKTEIVGVSRDSVKSHDNFIKKQELPFDLIADTDEKLCNLFEVIKLKNMYGKQVRGIERSTFIIDEEGVLRKEWRKVKVAGHVEEVLNALKEL